METYLISIVVPVYNASRYLHTCVESLLAQGYDNKEIVLVNDGSTDNSGELCDAYAKAYPFVVVIHKENGGLISAWTAGAKAARGHYLMFVDSDDWIDPQMLAEMSVHLTGRPNEIISSDYEIVKDNGKSYPVYHALAPGEYVGERLAKEVYPYVLGKEQRLLPISRCMKLISRELLLTHMHYCDHSIRMGEDTTIMLPCLLSCGRLYIMDHKTYYHYLYVISSMAHQYDATLYENNVKLYGLLKEIVTAQTSGALQKQLLKQADAEFILLLLLVLKNEARGNPKGYAINILAIAKDPANRTLIDTTPLVLKDKANRLLYFTLKHPNWLTVRLLRLAIFLFYLRQ